MNATRAAVEEGILPGGGVALLKASLQLATNSPGSSSTTSSSPTPPDGKPIPTINFYQELDIAILGRALATPACAILANGRLKSLLGVITLLKEGD